MKNNQELKISEFFNTDYVNFATYDVARKIGNVIDGNKISMRKILWIVYKKNLNNFIKTAQLSSLVALETKYKHGEQNLPAIIGRFTNDYVGTNNLPLLEAYGIFGTRLINEMSAPRYTTVKKSTFFDLIYNPIDQKLANRDYKQVFEGDEIEPFILVPVLPIVLVNGLKGVATGFSQLSFNRNIDDIIDNIKNYIDGKKIKPMMPYFRSFKGTIERENEKIQVKGSFKREKRKIVITELPISYDLSKYKETLDNLQDKKIILGYKDYSEDGFLFEVNVPKTIYDLSDDKILEKLELVDKYTENLTFQDKHGKIITFANELEVFDYFAKFRLERYDIRKKYLLDTYYNDLIKYQTIRRFIGEVMNGSIVVNNKPKKQIEEELIKKDYTYIDDLFNVKVYHFTKEKIEELNNKIKNIEQNIREIEQTTIQEMWWNDIKEIKKELRKYENV